MRVVGWRRDASARPADGQVAAVYGGNAQLSTFLAEADYIVAVLPSTVRRKPPAATRPRAHAPTREPVSTVRPPPLTALVPSLARSSARVVT
jgi:hypothetical protein